MDLQINAIVSQFLTMLTQFFIAFIPCLMGVYAKESYEVIQKKKRKVNMKNVIITALTLACVLLAVIPYGINKYGLSITFSMLFLIGASSKKIIEMIFDGSLLKIAYKFLGKSKESLHESIDETLKETENKKK